MSARRFSHAMSELDARYIEEALTYQASAKRRRARSFVRAALAACLALILTLGTAMAVSAAFREATADWVKRYESFTHYAYRSADAPDTGFVPHRLDEERAVLPHQRRPFAGEAGLLRRAPSAEDAPPSQAANWFFTERREKE